MIMPHQRSREGDPVIKNKTSSPRKMLCSSELPEFIGLAGNMRCVAFRPLLTQEAARGNRGCSVHASPVKRRHSWLGDDQQAGGLHSIRAIRLHSVSVNSAEWIPFPLSTCRAPRAVKDAELRPASAGQVLQVRSPLSCSPAPGPAPWKPGSHGLRDSACLPRALMVPPMEDPDRSGRREWWGIYSLTPSGSYPPALLVLRRPSPHSPTSEEVLIQASSLPLMPQCGERSPIFMSPGGRACLLLSLS